MAILQLGHRSFVEVFIFELPEVKINGKNDLFGDPAQYN
jgi:hypothetical protein